MGGGALFGKCGRAEALALAAFCSLVVLAMLLLVPWQNAVMLGGDEGFEFTKAYLLSEGVALYDPIWNDQPPLHTAITALFFCWLGPEAATARLVAAGFGFLFFVVSGLVDYKGSGLACGGGGDCVCRAGAENTAVMRFGNVGSACDGGRFSGGGGIVFGEAECSSLRCCGFGFGVGASSEVDGGHGVAGDVGGFGLGGRKGRRDWRFLSPAGSAIFGIVFWSGWRVLFGVVVFSGDELEVDCGDAFFGGSTGRGEGVCALCF